MYIYQSEFGCYSIVHFCLTGYGHHAQVHTLLVKILSGSSNYYLPLTAALSRLPVSRDVVTTLTGDLLFTLRANSSTR
jgi:hypothetical protein